jgi:predicted RNA binding protein YcfA (HicA-like mRNA interferase family)
MPPKFKGIQKRIEEDGWVLHRQKGSHRQFRHPVKPGIVTLAGKDSATPYDGTYLNILRQAGLKK